MASFIVGTAGHIDHGKSALVRALTGTDPDRLKEEKERGITIDLGFAHLDLGDGLVASFIDVPGHERFIRNMLAGAHGIDAVMLVVAADESVMPQTREHFHICRLLGIPRGLVVLTKSDVADAELQALAELEVRELVAGSFLEGTDVLRVSARTGAGLPELRAALRRLGRSVPPRATGGLLRLPIDRAFSQRGFGTVVTGTLVSGALAVGDEVAIVPGDGRARVRGLQVHGAGVERAGAGTRTAVNLVGLEVDELSRGQVLTQPGTLRPTSIIDTEIDLLPAAKPLRDQVRVRVHVASAEVLARVRVPGGTPIAAGGRGHAQLRLETPALVGLGDRLVLRSYSPAFTIGGARVLDPLAPKRRRGGGPVGAAPSSDDPIQAAVRLVAEAGASGIDAATLAARVTLPQTTLVAGLKRATAVVGLGKEPVWFFAQPALEALGQAVSTLLARYHQQQPLRGLFPREELRTRLFARTPEACFEHVLATLASTGQLRVAPEGVALASHEVRLSPQEEQARDRLVQAARAARLQGVDPAAVVGGAEPQMVERVSRLLQSEGLLRRVGDVLVDAAALATLVAAVRRQFTPGSRLDVAQFKELTGLSRKFVIPLLEYLDRERVTRRAGNDRVVLEARLVTRQPEGRAH